ncbi:hypothetical protein PPN31114_00268 [Pandoraea pneumonica]|uniref:Uncharacterized protein n=1 Tax=Pandoraea pneumonica TaxID=2508299 RepID=A0A5E4RN06_9BURK|nr:hypothetical protein PPN31114_00268 [Pandoraea pneumonica]
MYRGKTKYLECLTSIIVVSLSNFFLIQLKAIKFEHSDIANMLPHA